MSELVRAFYKTGAYIAELIEKQEENGRALVKVKAVVKHPIQGDLHHPKMTDVPLFHQRKALAEFEKTWVPLSSLKAYEGTVPSYQDSLFEALEEEIRKVQLEDSEWASLSLTKLQECKKEYGFTL
ncbi:kinase-associated lipoprotein B [Alkalihalobacillus sp. MEB130]|uniref:sporulation phosphorelay system protein KapB n=1 Tax=Alkalihalobacillus sp. MEB130 TaxID=2976704 RepID=UPI0028DD9EBE|nr:sporulation phosphorelay system protein KapB [Alkalihalobacillus sp. MEB130]MDT8859934.1 kinase-associated lipoprotein B [Alkalihalobacillus sp. MEB130]